MVRRVMMTVALLALLGAISACAGRMARNPYRMEEPVVKPGIEVLLENAKYRKIIEGKRVGLITNPTGVNSKLESTIDLLFEAQGVELIALFGPEHGIRGEAYAGDKVENYPDPKTGVTVYSLYGKTHRPKEEWLENIDVMLYDIQDIGATSYTYIYTMAHAMEECAKAGIPFVVLDRPNPVGADYVDGPVLNTEEIRSFIGYYPIAYMYGMTPGELAHLFNEEFLEAKADLTTVPMEGYERWMRQWDTGLPFVPTSTHIPHAQHAFYYSLTGIVGELRNSYNIGVGYTLPFECFAGPWINRDELTEALRAKNIPGVKVRPITFTPKYMGYKDEQIHGVHIIIDNYYEVRPVTAQLQMMEVLQKLYGDKGFFTDEEVGEGAGIDKAMGTRSIRRMIVEGKTADEIIAGYQPRVEEFKKMRAKYLIY